LKAGLYRAARRIFARDFARRGFLRRAAPGQVGPRVADRRIIL